MYAEKSVQRSGTNGQRLRRVYRSPDRSLSALSGSVADGARFEFKSRAGGSDSSSTSHDFIARFYAWSARKGAPRFAGEYRQGVTPVPIPNTEVKTLSPMILLSGKVGDCRLNGSCRGNSTGAFFIFARSVLPQSLRSSRESLRSSRGVRGSHCGVLAECPGSS